MAIYKLRSILPLSLVYLDRTITDALVGQLDESDEHLLLLLLLLQRSHRLNECNLPTSHQSCRIGRLTCQSPHYQIAHNRIPKLAQPKMEILSDCRECKKKEHKGFVCRNLILPITSPNMRVGIKKKYSTAQTSVIANERERVNGKAMETEHKRCA